MRFQVGCAFACFALVAVLAGCGRPAESIPAVGHPLSAPRVAACDPGRPGGVLTLTMAGNPSTFNPVLAMDPASDEVVRLLFSSLVNFDLGTQEVGPGLAESWSVEADQKTWIFKLRPGLRWSDAESLTADDVVFTWNELILNPDLNRASYDLFRIGGKSVEVSKLDDLTVRMVTPEPYAPFLEYLASVPVLPKHVLDQAVQERRFLSVLTVTSRPERVVGNGPFRLKDYQPDQYVLLERNPEYWVVDKQGRRLPYFDQVRLLPAPGRGAAALATLAGKCNVFERGRPEDFEPFKRAMTNTLLRLVEPGAGTEREILWFNQNTNVNAAGNPCVDPVKLKWFRNKKFRQAISCALDRDRQAREAYGGRAEPLYGFDGAEDRKWNNPNVPRFGYNPVRARALLAEIGIQDRNGDGELEDAEGHAIEITFNSNTGNPPREKCAALIAEDLRKLGLKVDYRALNFNTLLEKVDGTFDYECVLMGMTGGVVDPTSQMNVLKSGQPLHQWFPNQPAPSTDWEARIDSLMDAQARTLDFAERKKYFDEVQAIFADELPMICTVAPFEFAAIRSDIGNVRPSSLTPYRVTWNIEELFLKRP